MGIPVLRIFLIAHLLIWLSGSNASGQAPGPFELDPGLIRFLDLTPSQVAAILNNDREHNSGVRQRSARRAELDARLATEESSLRPNPARLGELMVEIEMLRREIAFARREAMRRNRAVLTQPQRDRIGVRPAQSRGDLWEAVFCAGLIPITRANLFQSRCYFYGFPFLADSSVEIYFRLSRAQVAGLDAIGKEHSSRIRVMIDRLQNMNAGFEVLRARPALDGRALGALRADTVGLLREIENEAQVYRARRLALLTPDQSKLLEEFPPSPSPTDAVIWTASCEGFEPDPGGLTLPSLVSSGDLPVMDAYGDAIECYRSPGGGAVIGMMPPISGVLLPFPF